MRERSRDYELGSVQGNWKPLKGKTKPRWDDLTDAELDIIEGKREELSSRIHEVWTRQKAGRRASQ